MWRRIKMNQTAREQRPPNVSLQSLPVLDSSIKSSNSIKIFIQHNVHIVKSRKFIKNNLRIVVAILIWSVLNENLLFHCLMNYYIKLLAYESHQQMHFFRTFIVFFHSDLEMCCTWWIGYKTVAVLLPCQRMNERF